MPSTDLPLLWILILAAVILVVSLVMFWVVANQRKYLGLPSGRIITADTKRWKPVEKALYDPILFLAGRPDYLVEQSGKLIPVEVKSQKAPSGPYETHILQLASYCRLVERVYHQRPDYGILHYYNRTYKIEYTSQLESTLIKVLKEMRTRGAKIPPDRSHESIRRCQGCSFRSTCDQKLL